jgi:Ca2+-binding RTX toxin-like protein
MGVAGAAEGADEMGYLDGRSTLIVWGRVAVFAVLSSLVGVVVTSSSRVGAAEPSDHVEVTVSCAELPFGGAAAGLSVTNIGTDDLYEITMLPQWEDPPLTQGILPGRRSLLEPGDTTGYLAELELQWVNDVVHRGVYFIVGFSIGSDAGERLEVTTATTWPEDCSPPPPKCNGVEATIVGTNAGEVIPGTSGRDVIVALGGDDVIRAGGGNDLICAGSGNDKVYGQGGADVMLGQGGNDVLVGAVGNDRHVGGPGRDTVSFAGSPNRVVVDLASGSATGWGRDRVKTVENAVGSAKNDVLRGTNGANRLVGGNGPDSLVGRGGNDVLLAGKGNDVLNGGPRRDVCNGQAGRDRATGCEVRRSIP